MTILSNAHRLQNLCHLNVLNSLIIIQGDIVGIMRVSNYLSKMSISFNARHDIKHFRLITKLSPLLCSKEFLPCADLYKKILFRRIPKANYRIFWSPP